MIPRVTLRNFCSSAPKVSGRAGSPTGPVRGDWKRSLGVSTVTRKIGVQHAADHNQRPPKAEAAIGHRFVVMTSIPVVATARPITPTQAKEARKGVRNKPKSARHENISLLESRGHDVKHLTQAMRGLPHAIGDVEAVIRALVQAHMTLGSSYLLEQVATTLEFEGRCDIAIIIRQLIGKDKGHVDVEVCSGQMSIIQLTEKGVLTCKEY